MGEISTQNSSNQTDTNAPINSVQSKRKKYLNRYTFFFLALIISAMLIGSYFVFFKNIFQPPLTAKMTLSKSTIKPIGVISKNTTLEEFEKHKTAITITYKNNTSKTLRDVSIQLDELKSAGDKNLMMYRGINIKFLQENSPTSVTLKVQDLPPKTTNYIIFHIVAQHKGSAQLRATVLSGELKTKTNIVSIKII